MRKAVSFILTDNCGSMLYYFDQMSYKNSFPYLIYIIRKTIKTKDI